MLRRNGGDCLLASSSGVLPYLQSWRLVSTTPSLEPPLLPDVVASSSSSTLLTYNEFLENILKPDKATKRQAKANFTCPGQVDRSGRKEGRMGGAIPQPNLTYVVQCVMTRLVGPPSFFQVGEAMRNHYELVVGALQIPPTVSRSFPLRIWWFIFSNSHMCEFPSFLTR